MKRIVALSCGLGLLGLCWVGVVGMAPQQKGTSAGWLDQAAPVIPELLEYTLQRIETPQSPGDSFAVAVRLGDEEYVLALHPYSLRAADFRLLVQGEDGLLHEQEPPAPNTYRGTVEGVPGSRVSASISDGRLTATIRLDDETVWYIVPTADVTTGVVDLREHAVFRAGALVLEGDWSCVVLTPPDSEQGGSDEGGEGGIASTGDKICDIACDADGEFYQKNGSSVPTTMRDVERVLNDVETIYENYVDVSYEVTTIVVWTNPATDPYSSTDPGTMLSQFGNYWSSNFTDIRRDTAEQFTGKNMDGGVIGIAWLSVICGSSAYSVVESRFTTWFASRVCLSAHELGHNWSAIHCDGDADCYIMCSGLGGCAGNCTAFGSRSISAITSFRNSRTCLTTEPAPQTLPFTESWVSTTIDTNKWVYNDGGEVNTNADNEPSGPYSLNLDSTSSTYGDDEIRTHFINLSGLPGGIDATVSYYTERKGVESGETLTVSYWNNNYQWVTLNTITSDGVSQTNFSFWSQTIPADGEHAEFRLKFQVNGNDTSDDWYIDDIIVSTGGTLSYDVTINSLPDNGVPITVTPLDNNGDGNGTTEFVRTYDEDTAVTLTAPLKTPDNLRGFVEWRLNGSFATTDLALNFTVTTDAIATAEYDWIFTLDIDSDPDAGVPITVSPADLNGRTDGTTVFSRKYAGVTDVTLTAPTSFNGRAFDYWEVNGNAEPQGQRTIVVNVDALSEYVLAYFAGTPADTLSIGSLPLSGVNIQVSPLDNQGLGDGTTPFERLYPSTTLVTLTAPDWPVALGTQLNFWRWKVGGTPQPDDQLVLNHTMAGNASLEAEYVVAGDMNGDNLLNAGDIPGFVLGLSDPVEYGNQYPGLDPNRRGDCNNDGSFNAGDIPAFVALLTG